MSPPATGTLLVVSGTRPKADVAGALQARLGQAVACCEAEYAAVVAGIRGLVAEGAQRLVILPLDLKLEPDQAIPEAVRWVSRRWPFLTFHAGPPLTWPEWVSCLKASAVEALATSAQTAVLIVGPGWPRPLDNANVARLAQVLREASNFARVDHAFLDVPYPDVPSAIEVVARLGLSSLVVVPWLLDATGEQRLADQVQSAAQSLRVVVAGNPLAQPVLVDILAAHHKAGLADTSYLAPTWPEIQAEIAQSLGPVHHSSPAEAAQLAELDRKLNALLPPQYQGRYDEVRPESMGTAALKFNPDGTVAWDEIWTTFCDLALAGGPPHRGTLLEAVTAADAAAEPEKYQQVVAEIERGIRLVTGLPVVPSKVLGWVGVRCDSVDMAVWLMRAIIVENVMVRRDAEVLYLPAGPAFTLKREIKNVVTVLAKTVHYWTAHLVGRSGRPGA